MSLAGKQQGQISDGQQWGKWEQLLHLYCKQQPGPAVPRWPLMYAPCLKTHQPPQVNAVHYFKYQHKKHTSLHCSPTFLKSWIFLFSLFLYKCINASSLDLSNTYMCFLCKSSEYFDTIKLFYQRIKYLMVFTAE